jgi:glutaminyl-peptide cyclotransferase
MRYFFAMLSIMLIASFSSCKQKSAQTIDESESSEALKTIKTADFNSDTAYFFVKEQVKFGPRVPNSKSQAKCAEWLVTTLKK